MKFSLITFVLGVGSAAAFPANSFPAERRANQNGGLTRELVAQLAPDLGSHPNTNPNKFGDCDGPRQPNGKIPKVPCACPPERDAFIDQLFANSVAGKALKNPSVHVNFPTGDSIRDKHDRITASIITLQNLNGPGKGCPGVSTTLAAQSKALDAGTPPPRTIMAAKTKHLSYTTTITSTIVVTITTTLTRDSTATATAAPEDTTSTTLTTSAAAVTTIAAKADNNNGNGGLTRDLVARLAPDLGSHPNTNPNKFGDCDGPRQPDGKIPKVPCACPPERDAFIDQLFANAVAGKALKNPSVKVNFPTGDSVKDKHSRITASIITLQNLNGPGKGCPGVSTTLAAQSKALDS